MNKKLLSLLLAALLLFSAPALASGEGVTLTDMMGREIALDKPATRIVALTAADCEIVCALGAQDRLVGRGTYCDYPSSLTELPAVDSGAGTNVEQIIALQPQAVVMSTMAQQVEQVEALEKAGIAVVVSRATDLAGVYEAIRIIGALLGKDEAAANEIARMQAVFADIAARREDTGKTVYFEVSPLPWGLWTAGTGTFMDEMATLCGLTNAFADVEGWAEISEEQVLQRDPDVIVTLTPYSGEGVTPIEEIKLRKGWEGLKAVRNDDIFIADSNAISRPGPRLTDAAMTLFRLITDEADVEPAA